MSARSALEIPVFLVITVLLLVVPCLEEAAPEDISVLEASLSTEVQTDAQPIYLAGLHPLLVEVAPLVVLLFDLIDSVIEVFPEIFNAVGLGHKTIVVVPIFAGSGIVCAVFKGKSVSVHLAG